MQERRLPAAVTLAFILTASCGGDESPTQIPTPAPVLVDYVLSGSQRSPDAPFLVDDELRLSISGEPIGTFGSAGVARFQAYSGSRLTVQALDTCQGIYYMSELWLHRPGIAPQRIALEITTCSVASVPCLSTVDCAAPDRVFFARDYDLP